MKCKQCGTEFTGKFCPECGAKWQEPSPVKPPPNQQREEQGRQWAHEQATPGQGGRPSKQKKPFFKRGWFIAIVIVAAILIVVSVFDGGGTGEKIEWDEMVLGNMLPEPPANKGMLYTNSEEVLGLTLDKVSEEEYKNYLSACVGRGFVEDATESASSYEAYNAEGYHLDLSYITDSLTITLEAPMEFGTIAWPSSTAGSLLPVPDSTTGQFTYENEDSFFVYVGATSKADFDAYVSACADRGFTVDYDKGDSYYYADNAEGWHIALNYEGNDIMSVRIDAPQEAGGSTPVTEDPSETPAADAPAESTTDGLDAEFKAAMDSYEAFIDEYVAFMEKYAASDGSDLSLLSDYADYVQKYTEFAADFARWEEEELNPEETAYYLEVQGRVSEKLLTAAQTQL